MGLPAIYGTQEQAKRHVGGWHAERMSIGPAIARLTLRHAQFYVVKGHNCHVKRGAWTLMHRGPGPSFHPQNEMKTFPNVLNMVKMHEFPKVPKKLGTLPKNITNIFLHLKLFEEFLSTMGNRKWKNGVGNSGEGVIASPSHLNGPFFFATAQYFWLQINTKKLHAFLSGAPPGCSLFILCWSGQKYLTLSENDKNLTKNGKIGAKYGIWKN